MKPIAMITGATSGIGLATAQALAEEGYNIIITGRRGDRLNEIKKHIKSVADVKVATLCFDVRDRAAVEAAIDSLRDIYRNISVLVNNAGLASGLDHIHEGDPLDWDTMVDTNLKGLLYVTRKVAKIMVGNGGGHIINIGSIAGTQPYEKGNVYCATKHAVHGLSQGMRMDLVSYGIKVSEIRPGMVDTEFSGVRFHGDKERADDVYKGVDALTGEDIAEAVVWILSQPKHVNIDEVMITPQQQASAYYTHRRAEE